VLVFAWAFVRVSVCVNFMGKPAPATGCSLLCAWSETVTDCFSQTWNHKPQFFSCTHQYRVVVYCTHEQSTLYSGVYSISFENQTRNFNLCGEGMITFYILKIYLLLWYYRYTASNTHMYIQNIIKCSFYFTGCFFLRMWSGGVITYFLGGTMGGFLPDK
jgi:hypothetical protein